MVIFDEELAAIAERSTEGQPDGVVRHVQMAKELLAARTRLRAANEMAEAVQDFTERSFGGSHLAPLRAAVAAYRNAGGGKGADAC